MESRASPKPIFCMDDDAQSSARRYDKQQAPREQPREENAQKLFVRPDGKLAAAGRLKMKATAARKIENLFRNFTAKIDNLFSNGLQLRMIKDHQRSGAL